MPIIIRKATINDLDEISRVESICFPGGQAASREAFEQRLQIFDDSFFVAVDERKIVGLIDGAVIDENRIYDELYENINLHNPNGKYQSIFGLVVIPEYRKQGIAQKLMTHIIELSREKNRQGLVLTCKKELIHYYEKFGYENKGISKSVHGNVVWYDMILDLK